MLLSSRWAISPDWSAKIPKHSAQTNPIIIWNQQDFLWNSQDTINTSAKTAKCLHLNISQRIIWILDSYIGASRKLFGRLCNSHLKLSPRKLPQMFGILSAQNDLGGVEQRSLRRSGGCKSRFHMSAWGSTVCKARKARAMWGHREWESDRETTPVPRLN